jgi:hypothetical protein
MCLQPLFKEARIKKMMSKERRRNRMVVFVPLRFGKRNSFVSVFIPTSLTGPADVHEKLSPMLANIIHFHSKMHASYKMKLNTSAKCHFFRLYPGFSLFLKYQV